MNNNDLKIKYPEIGIYGLSCRLCPVKQKASVEDVKASTG